LEYVDELENERYNSKAVFSELGLGVEVEEYNSGRQIADDVGALNY